MTNLEWYKKKIANMSIEEFVQILANPDDMFDCNMCHLYIDNECRATSSEECFDGIARWLKSNYAPTCHAEEKQETVTKVHMMCSCGGEYIRDLRYETIPVHKCTKCGYEVDLDTSYPYIHSDCDTHATNPSLFGDDEIVVELQNAKLVSTSVTNPFEGDF